MFTPPTSAESGITTPDPGFWLLLANLPKFGVRQRQAVLQHLGSFAPLANASVSTLAAMGFHPDAVTALEAWKQTTSGHPLVNRVRAILADCQRLGVELMTLDDGDYPTSLRHIHDAPLVLFLRGDRSLLSRPQIGIVGSRNASRAGLEHARAFAGALGDAGLLVTSGLALGVDGAAHAGALDAGHPTVAIIGNGVEKPYPHRHRHLSERIVSAGVVVSEYPPGTPARPGHFPRRNRIISGLSQGVLVVEAGLNSGSLITAKQALEQGREVFAIPGSIHNPLARGCHDLIRQGAVLVETVNDIISELQNGWTVPDFADSDNRPESIESGAVSTALDDREIAVLDALGYDPRSTDDLCATTGLAADELMQSLLLLELQGLVDSAPGGFQRIA